MEERGWRSVEERTHKIAKSDYNRVLTQSLQRVSYMASVVKKGTCYFRDSDCASQASVERLPTLAHLGPWVWS